MNPKKFTIVALIVVAIVIVVLVLLALLFRSRGTAIVTPPAPNPVEVSEPTPVPGGGLALPPTETPTPSAPAAPTNEQETALPASATILAPVSSSGSIAGYNRDTGSLFTLNNNGSTTPLTDDRFPLASSVIWSPDRSKAILEFPDHVKILYDLRTKKTVTLPKHWQNFSFSPAGDSIAFKSLGLDPENQWLAIAAPDGSRVVPIEQLGDQAFLVQPLWSPDSRIIALYSKPLDQQRSTVYFIGANHENFPAAVVEGLNVLGEWSPDGGRLLYSAATQASGWRPTLWMVNGSGTNLGGNRTPLNIQTWSDKCVFKGTTDLICAVPQQLPDGAGLVRQDLPPTTDRIVDLNIASGVQHEITTDQPVSADALTLSPDGRSLFVQDHTSPQVRRIAL